ncbi:MAG: RDD family protein [Pusillimonas sp.]
MPKKSRPAPLAAPSPATLLDKTTPNRLRRFACMMYEGVLLFGVIFLAAYIFDTLTQSRTGLTFRAGRQAVVFIAIGIYFLACWRYGGQTLPMKTWNVRLIDRDGKTPPFMRLVLRYLLVWVVPLIFAGIIWLLVQLTSYSSIYMLIVFAPFTLFFWTWFDPDKQFLHDRMLGTRLISV